MITQKSRLFLKSFLLDVMWTNEKKNVVSWLPMGSLISYYVLSANSSYRSGLVGFGISEDSVRRHD